MPAQPKWYKDGFILVTLAQSSDGYQHPRISVCKLYDSVPADQRYLNDPRLPSKDCAQHPTRNAETLLTFEFQQNIGGREGFDSEGEAWLKIDARKTSPAYGGHLDTAIRIESWGVDTRDISKKLGDVDKALKAYREKARELGAKLPECDASALMLALRTEFKLPVLFVVYRPGDRANAYANPDITQPTAEFLKTEDERKAAH